MSASGKQPLDYLDLIPDSIYQRIITSNFLLYSSEQPLQDDASHTQQQDSLQQRCSIILSIRNKLLAGLAVKKNHLLNWCRHDLVNQLYSTLTDIKLLQLTKDNETYTDQLLLNILDWLSRSAQVLTAPNHHQASNKQSTVSEEHLQFLNHSVNHNNHEPLISADLNKLSEMQQRMAGLHASFAIERQLGWDLTKGLAADSDIDKLLKLHKYIQSSTQLKKIIRLIGRHNKIAVVEEQAADFQHPIKKSIKSAETLPDEHTVSSVSGICLGDDLTRMLPSELLFLGHPRLKMLWHARRAESRLLNYHIQGVLSSHTPATQLSYQQDKIKPDNIIQQQGPMVICVDTSASMSGYPEYLAKAVVLESIRVAQIEKRACYLFNFSGKDEISEYKLNLHSTGWLPVIEFLKHSFKGGTDINAVLDRAFDKLQENKWTKADLLLVSDGRFKISSHIVDKLKNIQHAPTIYGIQVAQWNAKNFSDICHQTFKLNNAE